jgi:tetratricopeptide (TPR) repeat protein
LPFERALAIREARFGADSAPTAQSQHDLAAALAASGQLERAQSLLETCLAARERLSGPDSPEVAATLADLAEILRRRDQPSAAAPLLARAVATLEKTDGDGRALATALNNLAALRFREGAYRDAGPMLAQALQLEEKALGPDDPELAVTLDNYAAVLTTLERGPEAEAARHRATAIRTAQAQRQAVRP